MLRFGIHGNPVLRLLAPSQIPVHPGCAVRPATYVGIDIGGTKTAVILGRATGGQAALEVTERVSVPTPRGPDKTLRAVLDTIDDLGRGKTRAGWTAFGVSCGGPLDSASGLVLSPPNLPGWDRVPVVQMLEKTLGIPGALQNDANACALAEWRQGAGVGSRSMVFLTMGTGMGAGLILDGKLYEGRIGMAGEVGHVRLAEDGPEGYGKRGSFEGWCSGGGIARLAQERVRVALREGGRTALAAEPDHVASITTRDVCAAARAGDPVAQGVIRTAARYLGRGLALLVDLLNPERIVIGGVFARAQDLLLAPALEEMRAEALDVSHQVCRVLPSGLGESIGDIASLTVAALRVARTP